MKKLLVVALSAMLVFAVSAVSMAAVTWTGECNVGLQLAPDTAKGDFSDCKVVADAAINDTLSVNAAIKGTSALVYIPFFDTYSISNKFDMGTLKLGYFEVNLNGKKDILGVNLVALKPASLIQFAANVGEGMTAALSYDYNDGETAQYVASFKYDVAPLFVEVGMSNVGDVSGTALNVAYTIGESITPYLTYQTDENDGATQILGVLYTSGAISARLEYDLDDNDGALESNPLGLRLQYTAANSLIYTLEHVDAGDGTDAAMKVKVTAKF